MKCKFCGAEIKAGSSVCEYCDSAVENNEYRTWTIVNDKHGSQKTIAHVIAKSLVSLACIGAVMIVITMLILFNSDVFKNFQNDSISMYAYRLPQNKTNLTAQVAGFREDGSASITYQGSTYDNVKILDENLVSWLNDTNRNLEGVEIRFATDKDGNISSLGLLSADFFVIDIDKEKSHYTAFRNGHVISFTSEAPLESGRCYGGCFSYPDMQLYWGEEKTPLSMKYMDPFCKEKVCTAEPDYYTGEEITVYKIMADGKWHYCSKETYDAVQVGDSLDSYAFTSQNPGFMILE